MAVSLASLLVKETKAQIYATALAIAVAIGLNVSTWQAGDPTRSLYHLESETLAAVEELVVAFIASGFLDYATGDWLKILAKQVYNVDVPAATYASTDVVLTNTGGGVYDVEAGDLTFKSSVSGKTYHSTTGGHIAAGGTLTVSVEADEPGSDSSAGAGEIDELVTTLLGVTCSNALAATGIDEQSESTTRQQCRDRLGALSPNGPKDAYSYVARNSALTGTTAVTRVRVYSDSEFGDVLVYIAGPSGAISEPVRVLVEAALALWATPLCTTLEVLSASNVTVNVTYTLWIYKSCNKTAEEVEADVETALEDMFADRAIGGDILDGDTTGSLFKSLIESTIRGTFPEAFRVSVSSPASDTALTNAQVPALGTVTATINFVNDP